MWTWRELHNTDRYRFNNPFYPASSCLAGLKLTCFHFSCPGKAFEWVNWSFISNFFPSSRWTIEYRVHFSCDFSSPTFINYYISQFFSFLQMNGRVLSALQRLFARNNWCCRCHWSERPTFMLGRGWNLQTVQMNDSLNEHWAMKECRWKSAEFSLTVLSSTFSSTFFLTVLSITSHSFIKYFLLATTAAQSLYLMPELRPAVM